MSIVRTQRDSKITTLEMEYAVAKFFGIRTHLIVPNVSWGMGVHECDLFIMSTAGYATEVEIKISKSDLVADKKKRHKHSNRRIKQLYFAIPSTLVIHSDLVPETAGIIEVMPNKKCRIIRVATTNSDAKKHTEKERMQLMRLCCMRVWGLKAKCAKLIEEKRS